MVRTKAFVVAALVAAALTCVARAGADSTPIGPLPAGPVATLEVQRGELVAVALPRRKHGRVWRLARTIKRNVLTQVSEANVGSATVVVFRARSRGSAVISFALTASDVSRKALESRVYRVTVT